MNATGSREQANDKAVAKLTRDRTELLAFHDFPAEHWKHIRTLNPIESTFATGRHRTDKAKGCLGRKTGLAMAFRLMMSAQAKMAETRRRQPPARDRPRVEFNDGIKQRQAAA